MNVRPAPFALTSTAIAATVGAPAHSSRVGLIPVLPIKLVDRPRRSEDPRLSKANDDGAVA